MKAYLNAKIAVLTEQWNSQRADEIKALELTRGQLDDRLNRLTDAYLGAAIDKATFEERKTALLNDKKVLEEKLHVLAGKGDSMPDRLIKFLELAGDASLLYGMGLPDEKRDLVKIVTSNRTVERKTLGFTLAPGFRETAKRNLLQSGAPYRDIPRSHEKCGMVGGMVEITWIS